MGSALLVALAWATAVSAQPNVSPQDETEARKLFDQGNEAMDALSFAEAEELYRRALDKWPHPAFHYNLAFAQLNQAKHADAYHSFKRAHDAGPTGLDRQKYERAAYYMDLIAKQLARFVIRCDQPGVVVILDDRELFVGPGRYDDHVRPGRHTLVARKRGYLTETRSLVGTAGEIVTEDVHLLPREHIATVHRWSQWKPWAVVAGGALVLGGAAYLDVQSSQQFDRFDDRFSGRCPDGCGDGLVPDLAPDRESGDRQQTAARIAYAAGGAALITGVVLVYLNRARIVRMAGEGDDRSSAGVITVSPALSPGGVHASMWLEF